jgi:hypothetical protein
MSRPWLSSRAGSWGPFRANDCRTVPPECRSAPQGVCRTRKRFSTRVSVWIAGVRLASAELPLGDLAQPARPRADRVPTRRSVSQVVDYPGDLRRRNSARSPFAPNNAPRRSAPRSCRSPVWCLPGPLAGCRSRAGSAQPSFGVAVAPLESAVISSGTEADLGAIMARRGWADVVVKPAVSGTARRAIHLGRTGEAECRPQMAELLRREDAVMQRFIPTVTAHGELSVVAIAGVPLLAVQKSAAPATGACRRNSAEAPSEQSSPRSSPPWRARRSTA